MTPMEIFIMIQGIYTAVSGMLPRINQEKNIANNLANQSTNGYKKGLIFLRKLITAQYALDHARGVERTEVPEDFRTDYSQGIFEKTDGNYDVALNGSGFFRVKDTTGNVYYTRNGSFYLAPNGNMVTSSGMFLLNERNNAITITGKDVKVMGNGDIYEDGVYRDAIGIADFSQGDYKNLKNVGLGLFLKPAAVNETQTNPDTAVYQGYLEGSNVEPILAMVDMIEAFRMFELGQKSIQIQDQTLQRVVTEVGSIK